jgi:type I restriction-modification system DNA methylase subunit
MTITQIETNITKLIKNFTQDDFIFDFLLAYGEPKATITRLKKGELNQLDSKGEVLLRKKLFFKEIDQNLHSTIDTLKNEYSSQKQKPRFIVVTDYKTFLAYDTKTTDTLDIDFVNLTKHYDFFLPLAGMEKSTHIDENPADVKASNKLAKLYDEILKNNPTSTHEEVHALNVFLTRLLFCYFAEDSNIFEDNLFTNSIANHTQVDGSDLDSYLERLFEVFNTDNSNRDSDLPEYLQVFPYVNGGLFRDKQPLPKFTTKSRNILIEIGELDWSAINPDIFGSMIQAVVTPEHRGDMGMHYTSVPNIMKVMQPLFLDELYEEFEKSISSKKKLQELINRIANLKIFDPACGSGNFLIIAYKELRRLEMKILSAIDDLSSQKSFAFSEIKLTQFYGIELDDFAHEVAILSLWLAEHQMNLEFYKAFGRTTPSLPLQDGGNIVHGNATRIDWESVCPKEEGDEIYILGNPPYLGYSERSKEQKSDMDLVFDGIGNVKRLDYIGCWFKKATDYINKINSKYAFVSTNSISQGEQVSLIWPYIFSKSQEISFAHKSFNWSNNAKGKAGVTVVIIGIRNKSNDMKYLYENMIKKEVKNISPYLIQANNVVMSQTKTSISNFPEMQLGSSGIDGGHLLLTPEEKNEFIKDNKDSSKYIKQFIGGADFLRGTERYCLWIDDDKVTEATNILKIKNRINKCREYRLGAGRDARKAADIPHRFFYRKYKDTNSIILPMTSSSRREYLPIGSLNNGAVISNGVFIVYDSEPYMFGILSSKLHYVWMSITSARMRNDYRYSVNLTYNTFPFPNISEKQKEEITELVFNILDEREQHSEKTLAQLYDPDKMPEDLKEAHHQLDLAIEQCYRKKPFESDEERLEYLFKLYEEMIANEK